MKKIFRLSAYIVMALVLSISFFASACADRDTQTHTCGNICSVCGLCTDSDCTDSVCADKCAGHGPHECEQQCAVCGGCLDMDCDDEVCAEKCGENYLNATEYSVTDVKVAKSGATVDISGGIVTDFSSLNNASVSYQFDVAEATTVTMSVFVRRTVASSVYTDYVNVIVNDQKINSPAIVPALTNTAMATWSEINLGCIALNSGENVISFVANSSGINSWAFMSMKLYYRTIRVEWQVAEGVSHECQSVCETCGGCTDYSCYNPGCSDKCLCETQSKGAAQMYWALHPNTVSDRSANDELDGIGCTWNTTTTITYEIVADKSDTVEYGAVISVDTVDLLFTEQFKVTVNGNTVSSGTGKCPIGTSREWNTYSLVVVGNLDLVEGRNTITLSQTPVQEANGGTGGAYNFQSFVIFSDDVSTEWFEHSCSNRCSFCDYCLDTDCAETDCSTKCEGHVNPDADYTGYDGLVLKNNKIYKVQVETLYNYDKLNLVEGEELFLWDSTGKGLNGRALGVGSRIVVNFELQADTSIYFRPYMTAPYTNKADVYSMDGQIKFIIDGHEITDYRLQKEGKGEWTIAEQYINVTQGYINLSAGSHTFIIEVTGDNAPHINEIRLNAKSYGVWEDGIHLCSRVCSDCGGCEDTACTDSVCATKCSCVQGVSLGAVMQSYEKDCFMAYSTYRYRVI